MNRLLVLGFFAWCISAEAQNSNQLSIHGIGADSCGSYVVALSENRPTAVIRMEGKMFFTAANAYSQWLSGFVTAENLRLPGGPSQIQVDANGIALWVKNYCEANPSRPLVNAATAFVLAHRPRNK